MNGFIRVTSNWSLPYLRNECSMWKEIFFSQIKFSLPLSLWFYFENYYNFFNGTKDYFVSPLRNITNVQNRHSSFLLVSVRDVLLWKNTFFWIFSLWGGEGPAHFFGTFSRGAFLVNKGLYFFQNAINLNFKLFLGCIYIIYHIIYSKCSIFSPKLTFKSWMSTVWKIEQLVQIVGRGEES